MNNQRIETAKILLRHAQLMRGFVLRGEVPHQVWDDMPKPPTLNQIKALFVLEVSGPCTLKVLTESLGISAAAASELVERLVEMELVTRRRNPSNRRQVIIEPTPEAEDRLSRHRLHILRRFEELLDQMDDETVAIWAHLAAKINSILERKEDAHVDDGVSPANGR